MSKPLGLRTTIFLIFCIKISSISAQNSDNYFSLKLIPEVFIGYGLGIPYNTSGYTYDYRSEFSDQYTAQVGDVLTNEYILLSNDVNIRSRSLHLGLAISTFPKQRFSLKFGLGVRMMAQRLTVQKTDILSVVPYSQYTVIATGSRPVLEFKKLADLPKSQNSYYEYETGNFGVQYFTLPITLMYSINSKFNVDFNLTPNFFVDSRFINPYKVLFNSIYHTGSIGFSFKPTKRLTLSSSVRISITNVFNDGNNEDKEQYFSGVNSFMPTSIDFTMARSFGKKSKKV